MIRPNRSRKLVSFGALYSIWEYLFLWALIILIFAWLSQYGESPVSSEINSVMQIISVLFLTTGTMATRWNYN